MAGDQPANRGKMVIICGFFLLILTFPLFCVGQILPGDPPDQKVGTGVGERASLDVIGPGDQLAIWVLDVPDISQKPVRVDDLGYVDLPMLDRVHIAGLTLDQCREVLIEKLGRYLKHPVVSVTVVDRRSQPVTVLGAIGNPGIHQLEGHKTLLQVLAMAGGLRGEAGNSIKVTRPRASGPIPLENAVQDAEVSVVEIKVRDLLQARNPKENITILPNDVISVPKAEMIYVVGEVQRAGGFVLDEKESISVLQALSLAGGLGSTADPGNARILRQTMEPTGRVEISVDLKHVLSGRKGDVPLTAGDILFVPNSTSKVVGRRVVDALIQTGVGVAIWHR
jgi:polysaccharide export outer membrane protein